jgi:hypothetical protein
MDVLMKAVDTVSPETTLAIVLGASDFRKSNLESNSAFANSAGELKSYLRDDEGFGVPHQNILDLFDTQRVNADILETIAGFLTERQQQMKAEGGARDLLLYYTGHGGFTSTRDYFLVVRATTHGIEDGTSLRMADLASTIKNNARGLRRFVILDCCFSAAAFKEFQTATLTAAVERTLESFPKEGTTLLCSSNARSVSIAPTGAKYTMFSGALLHVLRNGVPKVETPLSMEQVAAYSKDFIRDQYPDEAVRPEIHSPDIRVEDVAHLPLFPNAATRPRKMKDQIDALAKEFGRLQSRVDELKEKLGHETTQAAGRFGDVDRLQTRVDELKDNLALEMTKIAERFGEMEAAQQKFASASDRAVQQIQQRLVPVSDRVEMLDRAVQQIQQRFASSSDRNEELRDVASTVTDSADQRPMSEKQLDIKAYRLLFILAVLGIVVAFAVVSDWYRPGAIPLGTVYQDDRPYGPTIRIAQWRFVTLLGSIIPSILLCFWLFAIFAFVFVAAPRRWVAAAVTALFWPASYGAGLTVASWLAVRISGFEVEYVRWLIGGLVGSLLGGLTAGICLLPILICVGLPALKRSAWLLISVPAWLLGWIFNLPFLELNLFLFLLVTAGVTAVTLYHLTIKGMFYDAF